MFLKFFALFFLGFFIVGFYNGRSEVNSEDYFQHYLLDEISLIEYNQKIHLAFMVDGERLYLYDVDSDSLEQLDRNALLQLEERSNEKNIYGFIGKSVTTASVSGFLGYQIKDIFKQSKTISTTWKTSKGRRSILAIIIGAVSGYSLGYWAATYFSVPDHTSIAVSKMLRDVSFWRKAEVFAYKNETSIAKLKSKKGNDVSKEISLLLRKVDYDTSNSRLNLTSSDFLAIRQVWR